MVTAEYERIAAAAQHRRHAAPIRFDARRAPVVKVTAVNEKLKKPRRNPADG